jgi:hypothetical protein
MRARPPPAGGGGAVSFLPTARGRRAAAAVAAAARLAFTMESLPRLPGAAARPAGGPAAPPCRYTHNANVLPYAASLPAGAGVASGRVRAGEPTAEPAGWGRRPCRRLDRMHGCRGFCCAHGPLIGARGLLIAPFRQLPKMVAPGEGPAGGAGGLVPHCTPAAGWGRAPAGLLEATTAFAGVRSRGDEAAATPATHLPCSAGVAWLLSEHPLVPPSRARLPTLAMRHAAASRIRLPAHRYYCHLCRPAHGAAGYHGRAPASHLAPARAVPARAASSTRPRAVGSPAAAVTRPFRLSAATHRHRLRPPGGPRRPGRRYSDAPLLPASAAAPAPAGTCQLP